MGDWDVEEASTIWEVWRKLQSFRLMFDLPILKCVHTIWLRWTLEVGIPALVFSKAWQFYFWSSILDNHLLLFYCQPVGHDRAISIYFKYTSHEQFRFFFSCNDILGREKGIVYEFRVQSISPRTMCLSWPPWLVSFLVSIYPNHLLFPRSPLDSPPPLPFSIK